MIEIFRGNDTNFGGLRNIVIRIVSDTDLDGYTSEFKFLGVVRQFSAEETASKLLKFNYTAAETEKFVLGENLGYFTMVDPNGNKAVSARIPIRVSRGMPAYIPDKWPESEVRIVYDTVLGNLSYEELDDLPKINDVTVKGDEDAAHYGLQNALRVGRYPVNEYVDETPTDGHTQSLVTSDGVKRYVDLEIVKHSPMYCGSFASWSNVPTEAGGYKREPDLNDFIIIADASDYNPPKNGTWQFIYTGVWEIDGKSGWTPEFQISYFDPAQQAAINSGITAEKVAEFEAKPTSADLTDATTLHDLGISDWSFTKSLTAKDKAALYAEAPEAAANDYALTIQEHQGVYLLFVGDYETAELGSRDNYNSAFIENNASTAILNVWAKGVDTVATRHKIGYRLGPASGPNADKPIASEAEAEALRSTKLDKTAVVDPSDAAIAGQAADALSVKGLFLKITPEWDAEAEYKQYNFVRHAEGLYYKKSAGSSAATEEPGSAGDTDWQQVNSLSDLTQLFLPLTGGTVKGNVTVDASSGVSSQKTVITNTGVTASQVTVKAGISASATFDPTALRVSSEVSGVEEDFRFPVGSGDGFFALMEYLAPAPKAKAYVETELVQRSGILYKCKLAYTAETVPYPEQDATHWEKATVEDVLAALRTAVLGKVSSVSVDNTTLTPDANGNVALPVTNSATASSGNVLASAKAVKTVNDKVTDLTTNLSDNYYTKTQTDEAIEAVAAYYITYNAAGEAFPTRADLINAETYYSGGQVRVPTRNDYAIVAADETHGGARWRYIYGEEDGESSDSADDSSESGEPSTPWEPQYPISADETDPYFTAWKDGQRIAVGNKANAYTDGAISIGNSTNATGGGAVAIGSGAKSEAAGAVEIGYGTNSTQNSLAFRGFQLAAVTTSGNETVCKIPNERLSADATLSISGAPADAKATGDALDGKASTTDATLTDHYTDWTCSPAEDDDETAFAVMWSQIPDTDVYTWAVGFGVEGDFDPIAYADDYPGIENALSVTFELPEGFVAGNTVTATRTKAGYRLGPADGPNADKPLASEAEAEALRTGKQSNLTPGARTVSGIIKTVFAEVTHSGETVQLELPTSYVTVNGKVLSPDVTLTGADIAVSGTDATKIDAALAGKASTADATLNLRGPNHDGFSDWAVTPVYPSGYTSYTGPTWVDAQSVWVMNFTGHPAYPDVAKAAEGSPGRDAISLEFSGGTTATRTALPGYRLGPADGPNADKPLASEAEAEALRNGKVSKSGDEMSGSLKVTGSMSVVSANGKTTTQFTSTNISRNIFGQTTYALNYPSKAGTLALQSDIPYALNSVSVASGTASLSDHAVNLLALNAGGGDFALGFPTKKDGLSRDFYLRIDLADGAVVPTISLPSGITAKDAMGESVAIVPVAGKHATYHFTETSTDEFLVVLSGSGHGSGTVTAVSVNGALAFPPDGEGKVTLYGQGFTSWTVTSDIAAGKDPDLISFSYDNGTWTAKYGAEAPYVTLGTAAGAEDDLSLSFGNVSTEYCPDGTLDAVRTKNYILTENDIADLRDGMEARDRAIASLTRQVAELSEQVTQFGELPLQVTSGGRKYSIDVFDNRDGDSGFDVREVSDDSDSDSEEA